MSNLLRREPRADPYRGAVLGLLGGVLGTLAMGQYWVRVSPLLTPDSGSSEGGADEKPKPDQNVLSPLGQQHEPGESSTAALGRHLYSAATGKTPGKQTRTALSEGVHWGTGILSGALFGALTARHSRWPANPLTGAAFGALLWASNDEGLVPLLGLQDGPAASPLSGHLNRLGAHVFFGAALGLGVWALDHVMPEVD